MTSSSDSTTAGQDQGWVPSSCTLPTVDQPVRVAEFDDLFARAVRTVEHVSPTSARLVIDADSAERARELAARESDCCSFFTFTFTAGGEDSMTMLVTVPPGHAGVLAAWTERAAAIAGVDGN